MSDLLNLPLRDFLAATAAKHPTPGGGSVSALAAALAAALAVMAMEYTAGKKSFASHDAQIRGALAQFQHASLMLQQLMNEDVAAYEALSLILKLPPQDRLKHPDYPTAVVAAIRAPQITAGFAFNILEHCAGLLDKTTKFLVSDLGVAAVLAHAALHASELNMLVNLPLLPNPSEAAALRQSIAALSSKADRLYAEFRAQLLQKL
ncbi:MAG TPA: cyclodeaminase/cyclohydrolase family protein [Phycisphaerae bacterium]